MDLSKAWLPTWRQLRHVESPPPHTRANGARGGPFSALYYEYYVCVATIYN